MTELTDIAQVINSVVNTITTRISGTITAVNLVDTVYTISTNVPRNDSRKLELKDGMFIEINNAAYQVSNVTANSFDITKDGTISISDTWKLLIRFDKGHLLEVSNTVVESDTNNDVRFKLMPMLWLMYDIEQTLATEEEAYQYNDSATLRLAFIHYSEQDYKADDREENILNPILAPLVNLFMDEVNDSTLFYTGYTNYAVDVYKRYKYGSQQNNANYIGSTITDSIEIEFEAKFRKINTCITLK